MIKLQVKERCGTQPARNVHSIHWRKGVPCTARDLIRERVAREFDALTPTTAVDRLDRHLVQYPRHAGSTLREAVDLALRGFETGAFFLVVDGRHIENVDQAFSLAPCSEATFLRLLPKLAA